MNQKFGWALSAVFAVSACGSDPDAAADADNRSKDSIRLAQLIDEGWQRDMRENPLWATVLGDLRYNDQLTVPSPDIVQARRQSNRDMITKLSKVDPSALSADERLNRELFERRYVGREAVDQYRDELLPFEHRNGVQLFHEFAERVPLTTAKQYYDWVSRMETLKDVIDQDISNATVGLDAGFVPPRPVISRVRRQVATQIVSKAEDSPFWNVFTAKAMSDSVGGADRVSIRSRARDVIMNGIVPAFERMAHFLDTVYLPNSSDQVGLVNQPDGADWYVAMAKHHTTTDMTPDDIHALGHELVQDLRAQISAIARDEMNFRGSYADLLRYLRTNPEFYFKDADALLERYRATAKKIDPYLPKLFGRLPPIPYGVRPIPAESAPDTTTAFYVRPSADGSTPGWYYVNLYQPETRPKFEIEVLTVHEAMPGHHLQIALQTGLDLPLFRRTSGYNAFVEGWGLYSETLGYDLGLYEEPSSKIGQLSYQMWRAVRLVVDTGMHYKNWSREQAIAFFADNAPRPINDIENEIDRYIVMPGQALAYMIGQRKIIELRDSASNQLGAKFNIRRFHDALLEGGALPLDILESRINDFVAKELVGPEAGATAGH